MRRALAALAVLIVAAQALAEEVHGKTDVFSAPGLSLAWAVERGPDEKTTFVVIRVAADPAKFRAVSITGRDPLTKEAKELTALTPLSAKTDLRLARAGFADFPRTEIRFFDASGGKPGLEVFYLGIPDTTPEFNDRAKLDAYLTARVGKLDPGPSPR